MLPSRTPARSRYTQGWACALINSIQGRRTQNNTSRITLKMLSYPMMSFFIVLAPMSARHQSHRLPLGKRPFYRMVASLSAGRSRSFFLNRPILRKLEWAALHQSNDPFGGAIEMAPGPDHHPSRPAGLRMRGDKSRRRCGRYPPLRSCRGCLPSLALDRASSLNGAMAGA